MTVPPVSSFLRKGKSGIKAQLFFEEEITWIAWMESYSPLKVWAGSREQSVGFQCHPLFLFSHTLSVQSSHSPGRHFALVAASSSPGWLWTQLPSMTDHNTTHHWGTCPHLFQRSLASEKGLIQFHLHLSMTLNFHMSDEHFYQVRRWPRCTDSM